MPLFSLSLSRCTPHAHTFTHAAIGENASTGTCCVNRTRSCSLTNRPIARGQFTSACSRLPLYTADHASQMLAGCAAGSQWAAACATSPNYARRAAHLGYAAAARMQRSHPSFIIAAFIVIPTLLIIMSADRNCDTTDCDID